MTFWDKLTGSPFRADITSAKRKPSKRVRVIRASRWSNYEGFDPDRGSRPRCKAKGCQKHLRRDQRLACCEAHEKQVLSAFAALKRLVEAA